MLRKKFKLNEQTDPEAPEANYHPKEFSLSQFANEPKTQIYQNNKSNDQQQIATSYSVPYSNLPKSDHHHEPSAASTMVPFWYEIYRLEVELCESLKQIPLPADVAAVYNPIEYACELHQAYMQRYLDGHKPVLFLGMNPGPWGMCQTGIPFGYVPAVRDWLQLQGKVLKPIGELQARPVDGLNCTRGEQSGQRWWGLYQELCGTPEVFFRHCFVYNICPLAFFHSSGRNITPADLKGAPKLRMQEVCTQYLKIALDLFNPTVVVSVGRYTEDRVKALVRQQLVDPTRVRLLCMPHPSPRSLNNTNWNEKAKLWIEENGLMPFLCG
ncbi:single-strand selective monofunctional uracil DNA glycosylase [Uranotaenia lowii]|uniref:single-strand selective monofunctional uracil DNA glycosylase n=1 Tax=Uranotaenia lowii TaxID=190385 RepID=UPI00247967F8|nr:single-strand selective monofunctional uracil DNA glycosylase [Uranotaenia lowii]